MEYEFKPQQLVNNFAVFQVGWFVSAFWHDSRSVVVLILLLAWLYQSEPWSKVRILVTIQVALIGIGVDSLMTWLGVLEFKNSAFIIPVWLIFLWFLFASTVTISLRWIMAKPVYAFVGGAIFGPLAYWGGAQFDALALQGWFNVGVLAIAWGLMMLIFCLIIKKQPNDHMVRRRALP